MATTRNTTSNPLFRPLESRRGRRLAILLTLLTLPGAIPAGAATRFWTGSGANNFWTTPANWSNSVAPAAGDILVFPAGAGRPVNSNNFPADSAFKGIFFRGTNFTLRGNRMTLAQVVHTNLAGTNLIQADLNLTAADLTADIGVPGATLVLGGSITAPATGRLTRRGGGILQLHSNVTFAGSILLPAGVTRILSYHEQARFVVSGTGVLTGAGTPGTVIMTNGGTWDPGAPVAALNLPGSVLLGPGSVLRLDLNGVSPGVSHDQVTAAGGITNTGGLLNLRFGYTPAIDDRFLILQGIDPATGEFPNVPNRSIQTFDGRELRACYGALVANSLLMSVVPPVIATERVWDGGGTAGAWTMAGNWVGNVAPTEGMSLRFAGVSRPVNTNGFPDNTTFDRLTLAGATAFTLRGNDLRLRSGIRNEAAFSNLVATPITAVQDLTIDVDQGSLTLVNELRGDLWTRLFKRGPGKLRLGQGETFGNEFNGPLTIEAGVVELAKANGTAAWIGRCEIGGAGAEAALEFHGNAQAGGNSSAFLLSVLTGGTLRSGPAAHTNASRAGLNLAGGRLEWNRGRFDARNFTLADTSTAAFELRNTNAGAGYGFLTVTGVLSLHGSLELSAGPGYNPAPGHTYILFRKDGAAVATGGFAGLPEGALVRVTGHGRLLQLTYRGGDGNDIAVTATSITGPSGITRTWSGLGADNLWGTPANWVDNTPPQAGDAVTFPSGTPRLEPDNNRTVNLGFNSLQLGGAGYRVTGNSALLFSGVTFSAGTPNAVSTLDLPLVLSTNVTTNLVANVATPDSVLNIDAGIDSLGWPAGLTKAGPGTLRLRGSNSFLQSLVIQAGTVRYDGRQAAGAPVIPRDNGRTAGTLAGEGRVLGIRTEGGTVAPSVPFRGTLTCIGNVEFDSNATYRIVIEGTNAGAFATMIVTGTVTLASATLDLQRAITGHAGDRFVILHNDGGDPVNGTFANLPEATTVATDGQLQWRIHYAGGDGNDVEIAVTALPLVPTTRFWTGLGSNNLWSTAANWSNSVAPAPGDPLVFPPGANRRLNINDLPAGFAIGQIIFTGSGYTFQGFTTCDLLGGIRDLNGNGQADGNRIQFPIRLLASQSVSNVPIDVSPRLEILGTIHLNGFTLTVEGFGGVRLRSMTGAGSLVLQTTGIASTMLDGESTFTGTVDLRSGIAATLNAARAFGHTNNPVRVRSGAQLELGGQPGFDNPLLLEGQLLGRRFVGVEWRGPVTVASNATLLASPGFLTLGGRISGNAVRVSLGLVDITGEAVHSGETVVAGDLRVSGSLSNSTIVVTNNGTVAGTGRIGALRSRRHSPAAAITPGSATGQAGRLACLGDAVLGDVAAIQPLKFEIDLNGPAPALQYDQLAVGGGVLLSNVSLRLNVGFVPVPGQQFVIIDNQGPLPVRGTFAGLAEGSSLTNNGVRFVLSYQGGLDGHDVELTAPAALQSVSFPDGAGGPVLLVGRGTPGVALAIESSDNLVDWVRRAVVTADPDGEFRFEDTEEPVDGHRFYRLATP